MLISFLQFWSQLNVALAIRGEPEARYGEARDWYASRVFPAVDERLVNRVINQRAPL
jgi:hypothetical protein